MSTTPKGAPYPESTDANNVPLRIKALAEWVDQRPGIESMTSTARAALTGAALWPGRVVYETYTNRLVIYADGAWRNVPTEATASGEWTAYTPTISGFPAPVFASARFRVSGRTCTVRGNIVLSEVMSPSGPILVTAPVPVKSWNGILGTAAAVGVSLGPVTRQSTTQLRLHVTFPGAGSSDVSFIAEYEIA